MVKSFGVITHLYAGDLTQENSWILKGGEQNIFDVKVFKAINTM